MAVSNTGEDDTEMHYMTSAYYTSSACRGARFDDPAFAIQWPLPATVVSEQDRKWSLVEDREQNHVCRHSPFESGKRTANRCASV